MIKLFNIASQDIFDGFVVDGRKRTALFGKKLETHRSAMLGEEILSTVEIPPVAQAYNLADPVAPKPDWAIAIFYGWIHNLYGKQAAGVEERLVEELTIREITHVIHRTGEELLPFLPRFGYRMEEDSPLSSMDDLIAYLRTRPATFHHAERLVLERIYDVDSWYGETANKTHMEALRQIKEDMERLAGQVGRVDPTYSAKILRLSDRQCHAHVAFLNQGTVAGLSLAAQLPKAAATPRREEDWALSQCARSYQGTSRQPSLPAIWPLLVPLQNHAVESLAFTGRAEALVA